MFSTRPVRLSTTLCHSVVLPFSTATVAPAAWSPTPRTTRPEAIHAPAAGQVPRVWVATM